MRLDGAPDQGVDVLAARHVRGHGDGAQCLCLFGDLRPLDIPHDDQSTLSRKPAGAGEPDSLGRPGHHRNLALMSHHVVLVMSGSDHDLAMGPAAGEVGECLRRLRERVGPRDQRAQRAFGDPPEDPLERVPEECGLAFAVVGPVNADDGDVLDQQDVGRSLGDASRGKSDGQQSPFPGNAAQ